MSELIKQALLNNAVNKSKSNDARKRRTTTQYYDNDEDDGDDYDNDGNNSNSKRKRRGAVNLPGGSGTLVPLKNVINLTSSGMGEVPREVTYYIRSYIDILFSSVALEANRIMVSNKRESVQAIPGVVRAILEYNNISFSTITMSLSKQMLPEPIWYYYNVLKNTLNLFVCEQSYDDFCMRNSSNPVVFTSGMIPIESLNPFETNPTIPGLDLAMMHCAIACDHVAQHIISDLLIPNKSNGSGIHEKFTDVGTTLHSMFKLEHNGTPMSKNEYCNYMTIMNTPSPTPTKTSYNILNTLLTTASDGRNNYQLHM